MIENNYPKEVINVFPTPVYIAKREIELSTSEMEYIRGEEKKKKEGGGKGTLAGINKEAHSTGRIIKEEGKEARNKISKESDAYIFDNTKLNSLKEFCEQNIATYVNEVINPKNKELDFYITQSWINILNPGDEISIHYHANSLISGVFYVSTAEGDAIMFSDINACLKTRIDIEPEESNFWNSSKLDLKIENNVLLLFPSWLAHASMVNPGSTTDRISISFNIFVKGELGEKGFGLNKIILQ